MHGLCIGTRWKDLAGFKPNDFLFKGGIWKRGKCTNVCAQQRRGPRWPPLHNPSPSPNYLGRITESMT
jgi:hypothetical protein